MNKKNLKLIMELIFIFILPLIFICFTSDIQVEREFTYDNNGNYETSQETKNLSFDNSIIKYTNGYKNIINNFNLSNNIYEIGGIDYTTGEYVENYNLRRSKYYNEYDNTKQLYIYNQDNNYLIKIHYYDENQNFILTQDTYGNTNLSIVSNAKYFKLSSNLAIDIDYWYDSNPININYSVNWANGNYVEYGKPLIIYSQTDISGQNNINYTIWGNIKQLLIDNLDLNDNVLLDIVLCYTILWIIMFIVWHFIYGLFELIVHIIPSPFEKE